MKTAMIGWCLSAAVALAVSGCGYSEQEFQAKLHDLETLQARVRAQQASNAALEKQLEEAKSTSPRQRTP
jgi:hypothetical protein